MSSLKLWNLPSLSKKRAMMLFAYLSFLRSVAGCMSTCVATALHSVHWSTLWPRQHTTQDGLSRWWRPACSLTPPCSLLPERLPPKCPVQPSSGGRVPFYYIHFPGCHLGQPQAATAGGCLTLHLGWLLQDWMLEDKLIVKVEETLKRMLVHGEGAPLQLVVLTDK